MENRNYWLFRVSEKWGKRIDYCKQNNLVCCGWNIGLSNKEQKEILKEHPWASRIAIKFCYIKEGDVIIMPNHGGIAIGIAKDKQYRDDLDWKDTINVQWLTKWYNRKDLTSRLQTRLKYRGTFLDISEFKEEFENIIKSDFITQKEIYNTKSEKERAENIKAIAEHINNRAVTYFQDSEFERFILDLFEIEFIGFQGSKNNSRQEFIDGKDLCLTYSIEELDLIVELNIQVKQHSNNASFGGIFQINKSANEQGNTISKNILVTSGNVPDEFREKALKENVYVYGSEDIAEMIFDNFSEIESKFIQKLNLHNKLTILDDK